MLDVTLTELESLIFCACVLIFLFLDFTLHFTNAYTDIKES